MFVSFVVNTLEKGLGNEDDYYTFRTQNDDDEDPYADCDYISEPDSTASNGVGVFACYA